MVIEANRRILTLTRKEDEMKRKRYERILRNGVEGRTAVSQTASTFVPQGPLHTGSGVSVAIDPDTGQDRAFSQGHMKCCLKSSG